MLLGTYNSSILFVGLIPYVYEMLLSIFCIKSLFTISATVPDFWVRSGWCYPLHVFAFNLSVILYLKGVSCEQYIIGKET
jgi:hypothetical protein